MKNLLLAMILAYSVEAIATSCKVPFRAITEDTLGNLGQGLSSKDADWFRTKVANRYLEILLRRNIDEYRRYLLHSLPSGKQ